MAKKIIIILSVLFFASSCATIKPVPHTIYIENISPELATAMTLEERISAAEAWQSLKDGRLERAKKLLSKENASSPSYLAGSGYVDLILMNLEAAQLAFKQAIEKFPDLVTAYVGLAQVYEHQGRKDQAFIQYREILKRNPDNKWALARLDSSKRELISEGLTEARAFLSAGKYAEAKNSYLRILFFDPENTDAHLQLVRLYRREKDVKNALFHIKAAVDKQPGDRQVLTDYAELLYESGDYSQSLDIYEKLKELSPENKTVNNRIAELKEKLGLFELPAQFEAIPSLAILTREDLAALIFVKFKSFLDAEPKQTKILVDIATSWAQRLIVRVVSFDIMKSYENYTFQPRKPVNRAELAETANNIIAFLSRKGLKFMAILDPRRIQIADVPRESYYYQTIIQAVSYGVLELTPDARFEPERIVSGKEAIRMIDILTRLTK